MVVIISISNMKTIIRLLGVLGQKYILFAIFSSKNFSFINNNKWPELTGKTLLYQPKMDSRLF